MENYNFKYFRNVKNNAVFTNEKCQFCGSTENCLEGEYFDSDSDIVSVCIDCLSKGKISVNITEYLRTKLIEHLKETRGNRNMDQVEERAIELISELSKNPPVPWIQYNDWPVSCGEFCIYVGEWDKEEFIRQAPDGNGKQYVMSILDDFSRSKIVDIDIFWNDIGRNTAVFIFECTNCSKRIAICQSY